MPLCMQGRSANSAADQSMHFWGICCESGKQYAQVVGQRFRITMAVLDPKSPSESGDKTVSLIVIRGGVEYLLCVLKHEEIHQVNLNLIFDKGENVIFYINGYGKVYLSGYQLTESENDVLNDENGYLCPLVEVTSESLPQRKGKISKSPQNSQSMTSKSKKKLEVDKSDVVILDKKKKGDKDRSIENSKIVDLDFDEESESDDEDYEAEEDSESDDDESTDSLEEDDDDDDEDDEDEDEDEVEQEEDDVEEKEEILLSKKSQKKRKLENISQPQKRSRLDSFNKSASAVEKSENVICLDDNNSKDSSVDLNSSIGHTPMPKKQTVMEKNKSKKKRLSEISNLSVKSVKGPKPPAAESTPNKTTDCTIRKLEGGVEVQDVVNGRGPEARIGKMVHVFYVGRFQNKQIFDSRLPGKKPFSFKLGAQHVIKGWDVGIQGMRVGGKRKLKIPPNMAYGSSSFQGVPPNSTLYFVVELQAVS